MRSQLYKAATALGAAAAAIAVAASPASALAPRIKVGAAAPLPRTAERLGPLAASTHLHLAIALKPQSASGLAAYATAVATPGSALYGRYLTVHQFAQRFGARAGAVRATQSALRAEGLSVGKVSANSLLFDVTGSAGLVERALAVHLERVRVGHRVAFANEAAPALPRAVAGYVEGVIGLDSVAAPQPQGLAHIRRSSAAVVAHLHPRAITAGPQPCSQAASINQQGEGYTADEIAAMYGMSAYYPGDEGAGETIALFEEEPFSGTDIATYQACYGTSAPVNTVNVDGGPGAFTPGDPNLGDDGEAALDIDQVIGLAPKATIDVYQGPDTTHDASAPSDILNAIVSQNQAKVISSSWGACEALTPQSVITAENTILQEAAAQGQSFFISSGDSGSTMCYQATRLSTPNTALSVIDPGAQPFATGVGGTSLVNGTTGDLPDTGTYPGEFVWNDGISGGELGDQASASGGGVSDQWAMPAYQANAAGTLGVIQSTSSRTCANSFCREVPDVSADADPNTGYAVFSTSPDSGSIWGSTGGTSAAAPLWAAFTALADASPPCRNLTLGFVNPALYQIAGSSYLNNFHDIASASPYTGFANNDPFDGQLSTNPSADYPVQAGYDMATGLGTPIANVLGNSLCAVRSPVYTLTVGNPGAQTSGAGYPVSLQIPTSDSGGAAISLSATGLPAGLTMSATGLISGTPSAVGVATVTISGTDPYNNTGSMQFTWTIVKPGAPSSRGSLSGSNLKKGKVKLSISVAAGANAAYLSAIKVVLPSGLSFVKKAKSLSRGTTVKVGPARAAFTITGHGGSIIIHLKAAEPTVTITVTKPAITESKGLEKKIAKRKVKKLKLGLVIADAFGHATSFAGSFKV